MRLNEVEHDGTCLYCGKYLPGADVTGKLYCNTKHKQKAQQKRARARRVHGICPRPANTPRWKTMQVAAQAAVYYAELWEEPELRAYKCVCQWWHLGKGPLSHWTVKYSRREGPTL